MPPDPIQPKANPTAHLISSHDPDPPKLPPLPEAILLIYEHNHPSSRWHTSTAGSKDYVSAIESRWISLGASTRILVIAQPTPPPEPTDEEFYFVAAVNGLRYRNPKACGEVACVVVDGKRFVPEQSNEPTDAEVAAIIREALDIGTAESDAEIMGYCSSSAACVRAALRKAGGK